MTFSTRGVLAVADKAMPKEPSGQGSAFHRHSVCGEPRSRADVKGERSGREKDQHLQPGLDEGLRRDFCKHFAAARQPNSASSRRAIQCSPPLHADQHAVCCQGETVHCADQSPRPRAHSQCQQPCLENHDPLYYHRPGAESRTPRGEYHSPPVCSVKVQSPVVCRDRGKGQTLGKSSTLFGISSCAMRPKDFGHITGQKYTTSPSKDISSPPHLLQGRRSKHCHVFGDRTLECSTPRNGKDDAEQQNLCTVAAKTPVSPKSPAGGRGYDGGGQADEDLHTILSPMSASFYQATGCLRDEWPSCYGYTGLSDDSQSLPQTPLSPLSASFYEATGCLPNQMLQSPSMYEHDFVNSPLQGESMIISSPEISQHAKDSQKVTTEIKNHDCIKCNRNNQDTSPFLTCFGFTDGRDEQSPSRTYDDPELPSPPDLQSCRFNLQRPLHIPQYPCHPVTPLSPPQPYPGSPAEVSVWDDTNTPCVTTPLSQDFVGLLENHLEVCVTRQEIRDHNQRLGWQQWFAFKGNVYTTAGFRDHFLAFNKKKAGLVADSDQPKINNESTSSGVSSDAGTAKLVLQDNKSQTHELCLSYDGSNAGSPWEQTKEQLAGDMTVPATANDGGLTSFNTGCESDDYNSESDSRGSDDDNDGDDEDDESAEEREYRYMWRYDVLAALRKTGLSTIEIESEIGVFRIGSLRDPTEPKWRFWDSVRADVIRLCDDLKAARGGEVSEYQREYMALLQRWLWRYGDVDPETGSRLRHKGVDGNERAFLLPSRQDSHDLRAWMADLPALDTSLPPSGYGWPTLDYPLLPPLGDTHSLFVASLRQGPSSSPSPAFRYDIDGDVAWAQLAPDVIRDDVMTQNQVEVMRERAARGSLTAAGDPARMARRREALGRYFGRKHGVGEEVIHRFLAWADVMARGWRQFQALCQQDS